MKVSRIRPNMIFCLILMDMAKIIQSRYVGRFNDSNNGITLRAEKMSGKKNVHLDELERLITRGGDHDYQKEPSKMAELSSFYKQRSPNQVGSEIRMDNYISMGLVSLMINSGLVFAVIMRSIITNSNLPIDINAPVLIYGIVVGVCCRLGKTHFLVDSPLQQSLTMYFIVVPIMLYKVCFYADLEGLQKNILQTLLVSGPGFVANSLFVGITIRYLFGREWNFVGCAIFGTACVFIYAKDNLTTLRQLGPQPQHISILLEGETIFGTLVAFGLYNILLSGFVSNLASAQDVIIFISRYLIGGSVIGIVVGKINCFFFWLMSSNLSNMVLFSTAMPLLAYYVCSFIIGTSGLTAIVICGLMMNRKKVALNKSSMVLLREYWEIISFIVSSIISTTVGATIGYRIVWVSNYLDYVRIILVYCFTYCGRFIIYVIMAPLSSRLGYGMTFQCLVVSVWGGVPSLANVCFAILPWDFDESTQGVVPPVFFYVSGMVIISLMLNIPTLPRLLTFLKLDAISAARERELTLCMEHLKNVRTRFVTYLKVEHLMAETSWKDVESETTLNNPYDKNAKNSGDVCLDEYITYCADCNQEIYAIPNYKEYSKLKERANWRFLKTRETLLFDNFSKGLITENSFKTLSSIIRKACDHPKYEVNIDNLLRLFNTELDCSRIKNRFPKLSFVHLGTRDLPSIPPNFYWRRLCYHIVRGQYFNIFVLGILLTNMVVLIVEMCINLPFVFMIFDAMFVTFYTSEFLIEVAARSVKSFWKDGLKTYFRSKYNTFNFCVLISIWICFIVDSLFFINLLSELFLFEKSLWFTLFKSVRLLRIFEFSIYSKIILVKILDSWRKRHLLEAFDIGKDFWIQEKHFLDEILPLLCDDFRMRREFRAEIERNLCNISLELQKIQHHNFWIAVTVKTKYAAKLTMASIAETVDNLMISGWIDNKEQADLSIKIISLMNKCQGMKKIEDNEPEKIFRNIPWLKNYHHTETLLKSSEMKAINSGQIMLHENEKSEGIFIITSGTCNTFYMPNEERLMRLDRYGELPVLDNIRSDKFEWVISDNILPGMTLGELSFLTGRSYSATVTVDFPVRAYFISSVVLRKVMEKEESLNDGLECRMWKHVSEKLVRSMLKQTSELQNGIHDERLLCISSLTQNQPFLVNDTIQNMALIDGEVQDPISAKIFKAPCLIPRCVKEIIFPENVVIPRIILILYEESQKN